MTHPPIELAALWATYYAAMAICFFVSTRYVQPRHRTSPVIWDCWLPKQMDTPAFTILGVHWWASSNAIPQTLAHEYRHLVQERILGPLFLPVIIGCWLVAQIRTGDGHLNSLIERMARAWGGAARAGVLPASADAEREGGMTTIAEMEETMARNAAARSWAVRVLVALAVLFALWAASCHGRHAQFSDDEISKSVHHTDTLLIERKAITETLTVARRVVVHDSSATHRADSTAAVALASSNRADSLAGILSATTIEVHDSVATVPAEVVNRFRSDSLARAALLSDLDTTRQQLAARTDETVKLYRGRSIDSATIASQKHTIDLQSKQKAPRCGRTCGLVIGGTIGAAVTFELVHLASTIIHKD